MPNILFELDRLRTSLTNKGLDSETVERLVSKASNEIKQAFSEQGEAAMQLAIEAGVEKRSPDFINDLKMDEVNMELTTMSNNFDFTEPPFPMLSKLLQGGNIKPMKDGSGVYKVIPVGSQGKTRSAISSNIYDVQKALHASRLEEAKAQYSKVAPRGSKSQFRTATSKQDANTQWVLPEQPKDFTEDVKNINSNLSDSMESIIKDIVSSYEENF